MSDQTLITRSQAVFNLGMNNPRRFESATLLEVAELGRQQGIGNDLLQLNARIAYENNKQLQAILAGITQLHESGEQERAAAERERRLKEMLYQASKLLKADQKKGLDPVELGLRARLFLHTVRDNGLSTADLSDLSEKKLFDALTERASKCVASAAYKELEDFEMTYGLFGVMRDVDPLSQLTLDDSPATPPGPEIPPPPEPKPKPAPPTRDERPLSPYQRDTFDEYLKEVSERPIMAGVFFVILLLVARVLFWFGLSFLGYTASFAAVGMIALGIYWHLWARSTRSDSGTYELEKRVFEQTKAEHERAVLKWEDKWKQQIAAHEQEVAKWEAEHASVVAAYEESVRPLKEALQQREDQIAKRKQEVRASHQAMLIQMHSSINAFLDDHPGLQEFLPKVSQAVTG